MRFDRATIALVPRTTSNCLDLAVKFYGSHLLPILKLWVLVALPSAIAIYYLSRFEYDLRMAALVFLFATSPLGVMLIAGAAPSAFGESFAPSGIAGRLNRQTLRQLASSLLLRCVIAVGPALVLFPKTWQLVVLGIVLSLFPGCWVALRTSFHGEKTSLTGLGRHLHDRRTSELIKQQIGELVIRSCLILTFTVLLWFTLFLTIDIACWLLFSSPIVLGRLGSDLGFVELGYLLWYDPLVLSILTATGLLAYPVGRLAWLFCYVDLRVRVDLWDMELQFTHEANRLGVRE